MTIRLPLGRAHLLATAAIRDMRRAGIPADFFSILGDLRRFAPEVAGVAVLAVAPPDRHRPIVNAFAALPLAVDVVTTSATTVTVTTARGHVTLCTAAPEDAGPALVWHTGSEHHNRQLQARAERQGLRFADGRLTRGGGASIACATEHEFYRALELPLIPPELREGGDEIAAAEHGELPNLISDLHVRGDLHMHTTWSDGRDTLDMMVAASRQIGYEYVAITDHSERSWASRRLTASDVPRQREEIEALRARVSGIQVLHGVEVDIMPDGTLDFSDDLLSGFDIVLASLHDDGGHDGVRLTERYIQVMQNPLVNVITHPANRSPTHSPGYELDFDRLFAAAVDTGTALEIDGAPGHLDMDGAIARRAAAAGVTLTIDSDCHRAEALARQMKFGIGTARRGWVEPHHVLNTRGVDDVRAFVAKKRNGRS